MTEEEKNPVSAENQVAGKVPPSAETEEADGVVELAKAMALAAVIALCIRTFLFEPFNIPSGSMLPTLLIGDYLFVEKYSYGYSKYSFPLDLPLFEGRIFERSPKRGDVVVFRQPKMPTIDYIKRIVGLPGDKIQVKDGILNINGTPVLRAFKGRETADDNGSMRTFSRYIETLPDSGISHSIYELSDSEFLDDTVEYTVPEGQYFAMGDNRDRSQDSRVQAAVGFIPAENLVGRAFFIFFSTEGTGTACDRDGALAGLRSFGCKLVKWPAAIRYSRIFKRVHSL